MRKHALQTCFIQRCSSRGRFGVTRNPLRPVSTKNAPPRPCGTRHVRLLHSHNAFEEATNIPKITHAKPDVTHLLGQTFPKDHQTNITESILSKTTRSLHRLRNHPLSILARLVKDHLAPQGFEYQDALSPVVTPERNFDDLLVPVDHVSRKRSESYYLNERRMLRPHTSVHQVELMAEGKDRFLIAADVYRRDEIDSTHYPVFHQMEGVCIWKREELAEKAERETRELRKWLQARTNEKKVSSATLKAIEEAGSSPVISNPSQTLAHTSRETQIIVDHLKATVESMIYRIFNSANATGKDGEPVIMRWIDAYFPFTAPSFEVEVWYQGKWLEVAGCGVIRQEIVNKAGQSEKLGWAMGMGLERLAMPLYSIPDIRLFWSSDSRFLDQFSSGKITAFRPFSKYPPAIRDVSFWCPSREDGILEAIEANDVFEVIRGIAGDLVESVTLVDEFHNKKNGKMSRCYRIVYGSVDKMFTNDEINIMQENVRLALKENLKVTLR